jgi:hypothetical protein
MLVTAALNENCMKNSLTRVADSTRIPGGGGGGGGGAGAGASVFSERFLLRRRGRGRGREGTRIGMKDEG